MSENSKRLIYGIDLGTTYSAISYVNEHGKAEIITNSDNERVTPSVVFFESEDSIIVGRIAKESAKTDPERVVDFVKRQMNDKNWTFELDGRMYTPEEISAQILKRLVNDAMKSGEHDVRDVVITCPAYFGDLERTRTRQAGQIIGLNVVEILDEPVAAAINYGLNEDSKGKNVIVYDLGGGTFDVTVVKIGDDPEKNEISIICTEGDHQLGGKDWDDRIVQFYVSEFQNQTSYEGDILEDPETKYDLRINAENDKKTLTNRDKVVRRVFFEGEKAVVELTREKFDEITEDLLEVTIRLTDKVLETAKEKGIGKIDTFLLVGGSTRMPQIEARLIAKFGESLGIRPISYDIDEAVAKGAAKVGEIEVIRRMFSGDADSAPSDEELRKIADETGKTEEEILLAVKTNIKKVATKSYGIRSLKNGRPIVRNLITKQSPVPASGSQVFGTAGAADEIDLIVFANNETESDADVNSCEQIGEAVFTLPNGLPEKSPIEIIFQLSDEGALGMTAIDQTHGQTLKAEFKAEGVMSEEEFEAAKKRQREITVD